MITNKRKRRKRKYRNKTQEQRKEGVKKNSQQKLKHNIRTCICLTAIQLETCTDFITLIVYFAANCIVLFMPYLQIRIMLFQISYTINLVNFNFYKNKNQFAIYTNAISSNSYNVVSNLLHYKSIFIKIRTNLPYILMQMYTYIYIYTCIIVQCTVFV